MDATRQAVVDMIHRVREGRATPDTVEAIQRMNDEFQPFFKTLTEPTMKQQALQVELLVALNESKAIRVAPAVANLLQRGDALLKSLTHKHD